MKRILIAPVLALTLSGCLGLTPEQKTRLNENIDKGIVFGTMGLAVANLAGFDPIQIPPDEVEQTHADCMAVASLRKPITDRRKAICDLVAQAIAGRPVDPAGELAPPVE